MGYPGANTVVELWKFASAADALRAQTEAAAATPAATAAASAAPGFVAWKQQAAQLSPELSDHMSSRLVVLRPAKWSNWQ